MKSIVNIMKSLLVFVLIFGHNFSKAQCDLTITTSSPSQVCPGTVVNATGVATVYGANQSFNFNVGSVPSGWSVAGGASFSAPCGAGPGGNYFWASTAGSGVPFIQTAGFDVCSGGSILFDMRYAVQGGASPCEGPDLANEGVTLQYSLNNGATWIDIVYYSPGGYTLPTNPNTSGSVATGATAYTTWNTFGVAIPPGAISNNTMFRWVQDNSSGTCCDNWGLDNIFINAGPCLSANIVWGNGDTGANATGVINSNYCLDADVYDDFGNFLCTSSTQLCFTVFTPSINGGPDVSVCNGTSITLSGSGGSGFTWDNGVTNGVPFTPPLGTTTYTVSGTDVNGCAATDQVVVTVTPGTPPTITPVGPVCINNGLVALSGSPAGGTFSGTGVTGTNFNPATAGAGTHTITYATSGGCSGTVNANIVVNPLPTVSINAQANLCANSGAVTLVGNPAGGTFSGTGMTGSSFNPTTAGPGTHLITYNYTDANGCSNSATRNITVTPNNTIAAGTSQTVCMNSAITNITMATTAATGATFTGLPAGVTGSWAGNVATISGTPTVAGTYNYTVTTTGGCPPATTTGTITVTPANTIAAGTSQTTCINSAITNITLATTGATGATFTGLPAGVTGSWAGNVATISGTPTASGTFNYTVTTIGGCPPATTTGTITVTPLNTIAAGTNQTTCINSAITNITLATTGATGATITGLPAGISGSWSGNVVTISGTPTASGTFNYTVTTTGGCPPATTTGTITVTPLNTIAAGVNETACVNSAITNITLATTGATGATFTGLPAGVIGSWAGNVATISGTPTVPGTFNYTVTTTGGCPPATATGTITVVFNNTIAAGTNQTACINSPITNISLATAGATGATFAGLPPGVTGSWSGNTVTISGTPTAAGTYNYTVTTTGGCPPAGTTGTITVNPLNTIAAGTNQTVCMNSAITNITMATTAATGATFTGLPAGVTGSWAGNVATISGTPTVAGTYNYTVTTTGGCPPATTTGTITVTPANTIAAGTSQTTCINSAITNITLATTGATGATFTGLPAGVTGSWAGNVATISGTPTASGTFNYTVTTIGGCPPATTTGTITVTPLNTIAAGTNQTTCINSAITNITLATTGATGATITGLPAGISGSWSGNVVTISGTPTASGTFNYTVTTTGGCPPATTTGTITVTPLNTIAAGVNTTTCTNSAISNITLVTTGATGATFTGLPAGVIGSWAGNVATISGTPTVSGTFNYTVTTTGGCPPATASGTITVTFINTIAAGTSQTVCVNSPITNISLATAGATGATFAGLPPGVTGSWSGNTATITGTPTVAGTYNYTVTTTGGCPPAGTSGTITVNPLPTAVISGDIELCHNDANPNITFTGATGTAPYTFTYNINGGASQTVTTAAGSSSATVSVPTTTPGTFVYNLVSVQDGSASTCSNPQAGSVTVVVYSYPPIDAGIDQLICQYTSTSVVADNPTGVPIYWNNGVTNGVNFTPTLPGTYTVSADNNGCISTDDVFIDIELLPTIDFTGDILQGCEPLEVNFTSTSSSASGLANCVWNFGDGNTAVGCGSVSNTFENAGYYDVTLTATSNNGCVNSETFANYIYVEAYPDASFTPTNILVTSLQPVVNYENTSTGASSYVWDFGDGSAESSTMNPTHTFPAETAGSFTVMLIASSPIGCVDTAYGYVRVEEVLIYYLPNTFTPDGDNFNETFKPVFTDGFDPYSFSMFIYNRWGEVVWESHDTTVGWNGRYGGLPVQDGTYTWKIEFKTSMNDERIMDVGHVNIIR